MGCVHVSCSLNGVQWEVRTEVYNVGFYMLHISFVFLHIFSLFWNNIERNYQALCYTLSR